MPRPIEVKPYKPQWFIFPESLPGGKFSGYNVRDDETQNRGSFSAGQNVAFTKARTPTPRFGWEVLGTEAADATPVKRSWVFERRDGVQVEFKAYSTRIDFWIHGVSTTWLLFKGSFTSGKEFAFANIGQSDQVPGWFFLCNGQENPFRATALHAILTTTTANTIVTSTSSLSGDGFTATGTVIVNGTEYAYTGLSSGTFTGVSPNPSAEAVGSIVMQSPVELTGVVGGGTDPVKFSVGMAHDGRLHYRREARKSVWDYSRLDNPDDVATGSTDGDGGAKEVEFGGPITAFGKLNKTAICFKKRIIKLLDFIQVGTRLDSPRYQTLVSVDDKGTTLGAVNQKSTFTCPLGMVFVTPDKRLVLLTGITQNNEPQYVFLSDPIQSVFDDGVFDEAAGICVDNFIYLSFKTNVDSTANDVVLRGDLTKQSIDSNGQVIPIQWDTPYIGINANDFTAVYNNTDEKNEVHWHSSFNSNTYRFVSDKTDGNAAFTSIVRTWSEHFDLPQNQKKVGAIFVEIKMLENTEVTATTLYDEQGVTGQDERVLDGDDTNHRFNSQTYNPFGASEFGSQRIGSNDVADGLKTYRFEIETKSNVWFHNIALQFSADGENHDFEIVRFGYLLVDVAPNDKKYKLGV